MRILAAASAVTRYAGTLPQMLPHFAVIAAVVAVIVVGLVIYSKRR